MISRCSPPTCVYCDIATSARSTSVADVMGEAVSSPIDVRTATSADLPVLERELPLNTPTRHRECLGQQDEGRITYVVAWQGHVPAGHGLLHWSGPRNAA